MKRLLFVILAIGCASQPTAKSVQLDPLAVVHLRKAIADKQPVVIGIIGNSIGCGYDAANARYQIVLESNGRMTQQSQNNTLISGWPQMLNAWLRSKNSNSIIWNLSGSGWTTQNHLDRDTVSLMAAMNPKPTVIFLPLQVNDRYKAALGPGFPNFEQFKKNTILLIQAIQVHGMTPVLVKEINEPFTSGAGLSIVEHRSQSSAANHHAWADYMVAIDAIGAKHGIEVIDTYTPSLRDPGAIQAYSYKGSYAPLDYDSTLMDIVEPWGFNGIHPNKKGHNLIFSQYVKWLRKVRT